MLFRGNNNFCLSTTYIIKCYSIGLTEEAVHANIRNLLTQSVEKRMMSNRRIGCLLSGGLDSSLIAAILVKLSKEKGIPYPIQVITNNYLYNFKINKIRT